MFKIELFCFLIFYSFQTKMLPNAKTISPCPMSPNITPNKKGNVIFVNSAGLISLYLGTPYVSTIYCAGLVKSLRTNEVGYC